jgi:signal peptidase I
MEPTLLPGDRVILSPAAYLFSEPKVGDIIVFYYERGNEYFTKRIAAAGGDLIERINDVLYINGEPVLDIYSNSYEFTLGDVVYPLTVPRGAYFVMGDNKNPSFDSRWIEIGCIPREKILGRVIFRIYPFNRLGIIR